MLTVIIIHHFAYNLKTCNHLQLWNHLAHNVRFCSFWISLITLWKYITNSILAHLFHMMNDNIICKKQIHITMKIINSIKSENMKMNYTQINKILKIDKFTEWKQISNSEFIHFTLWVSDILNNNAKLCLMKKNLSFNKYILEHIFNNAEFIAANLL